MQTRCDYAAPTQRPKRTWSDGIVAVRPFMLRDIYFMDGTIDAFSAVDLRKSTALRMICRTKSET